jgi:nucleotide-binding universal stress UspA family protein
MSSTALIPVENHASYARAVAGAAADVESPDTEAVVLHVFDDDEEATTRENLDDALDLSLDDLATRKTGVAAASETLTDGGFDVTPYGTRVDESTAAAILDARAAVDADRVYLYGRRRSPAGKAVFGSVVQQVVLDATVPVTIVPATGGI